MMKLRDLGALVLLAALWGGSFLFMRVAAPALGPIVVAAMRVALAAFALLGYALAVGLRPGWRAAWRQFLIMGGLNAAIPFTLITAAELHLTAGLAAILNATTPLFAALAAALWLGERLTLAKGAGLFLGICGVVVLVGWSPLPPGPLGFASIGASLLAALFYAVAGVYAKRTFVGIVPLRLALGQQLGATALLLPLAIPVGIATAPTLRPTPGVIAAILALAILCTSVAYLLYFYLIASVGPTKTLSVTFLVPVFGLLWSTIFLHEPLGISTLLGFGLILLSVLLVTGLRLRPARPATADSAPISPSPTR
ncbi:MAG TPA: DMT family transporter [Thermomicrobiales bacterium]